MRFSLRDPNAFNYETNVVDSAALDEYPKYYEIQESVELILPGGSRCLESTGGCGGLLWVHACLRLNSTHSTVYYQVSLRCKDFSGAWVSTVIEFMVAVVGQQ